MQSTAKENIINSEELAMSFAKSRDLALFEEIYLRFAKTVFNSCFYFLKNEQDAEDAAQEVFLKLFINISKFSGRSKFSTWLNALTYNHCINTLTRDKGKKILDQAYEIDDNLLGEDEIDDTHIYELKLEILAKALDAIDPQQRMILLLKYKDDMSIKDLMEFLEIGESAAKMRLARAKQNLLTIYKSLEYEYQ